jgi:hypothetical protein
MNQAVNPNDTRKPAALKLTIPFAATLTVGRALVVARAASVAIITNATVNNKKRTSIITRLPNFRLPLRKLTSNEVVSQTEATKRQDALGLPRLVGLA